MRLYDTAHAPRFSNAHALAGRQPPQTGTAENKPKAPHAAGLFMDRQRRMRRR